MTGSSMFEEMKKKRARRRIKAVYDEHSSRDFEDILSQAELGGVEDQYIAGCVGVTHGDADRDKFQKGVFWLRMAKLAGSEEAADALFGISLDEANDEGLSDDEAGRPACEQMRVLPDDEDGLRWWTKLIVLGGPGAWRCLSTMGFAVFGTHRAYASLLQAAVEKPEEYGPFLNYLIDDDYSRQMGIQLIKSRAGFARYPTEYHTIAQESFVALLDSPNESVRSTAVLALDHFRNTREDPEAKDCPDRNDSDSWRKYFEQHRHKKAF